MRITILGSGTATPNVHRSSSSILVQTTSSNALIDMGAGSIRRLCEAGVDHRSIDLIIITHFHVDHVADLAPFLFAANYAYGPRREEEFVLVGPMGMKRHYEGLQAIYGGWIVPEGGRLKVYELRDDSKDELSVMGIGVKSIPALHSPPALSYRLEAQGKTLTISGDTDFSDNIVELAKDSDVLITECSLPDHMKAQGHLTPSEAGLIADKSNSKRLVLTHMYPPCEDADLEAAAGAKFSGDIVKAFDLMSLEI